MARVRLPISKKKLIYLAIILLNILIAGFVIYILFFKDKEKSPEVGQSTEKEATQAEALQEVKKTEASKPAAKNEVIATSTSLFEDPLFNSLKVHGDLPIKIGEVGRKSPFDLFPTDIPTTTEITTGQQE